MRLFLWIAVSLVLAKAASAIAVTSCSAGVRPVGVSLPALKRVRDFVAKEDEYAKAFWQAEEPGAKNTSRILTGLRNTECNPTIEERTHDGKLAVVISNYDGRCYGGSGYAHSEYLVEPGAVSVGDGTSSLSYPAYRVFPPTAMAKNFMAGKMLVYLDLKHGEEVAYEFDGYGVPVSLTCHEDPCPGIKIGPFEKPDDQLDEFTKQLDNLTSTGVDAAALKAPKIIFIAPRDQGIGKFAMVTETGAQNKPRTLNGLINTECDPTIKERTRDGKLAVVISNFDGRCYGGLGYAHSEYVVEPGTVSVGDGTSFLSYPAYRVFPPTTMAKKFMAGKMLVYLDFKQDEEAAYGFDEYGVPVSLTCHEDPCPGVKIGPFEKPDDQFNKFTKQLDNLINTGVDAAALRAPKIIFIAPQEHGIGKLHKVSDSVSGAWLAGSVLGYSLEVRQFEVPGVPIDPSVPAPRKQYHPGTPKYYYPVARADGKEGVLWSDAKEYGPWGPRTEGGAVYMTWFAEDLASAETQMIYNLTGDEDLYAAASNGQDGLVLITAADTNSTVRAVRIRSDSGAVVKSATLHSGFDTTGLDFASKFGSFASAAWDAETDIVGMMFSENWASTHQGCHAETLNASTLELLNRDRPKSSRVTASHSVQNGIILADNGSGEFIGYDIGDNFPRGIGVHRINAAGGKTSRVVYAMKTQHYQYEDPTECADYGIYFTEGNITHCKRSNDNKVYSEMAHPGVVDVDDGLLVVFTGEQPPLRSRPWKIEPRDIGIVKLSKDLSEILSPGQEEKGGFYNFGGGWSNQSHKGINFITSHSSIEENGSRVKTYKLGSKVLVSYEIWGTNGAWDSWYYVRSQFLGLDKNGAVVHNEWNPCYRMQVPFADHGFVRNGKGVVYSANAKGLLRYEICAGDNCYKQSASESSAGEHLPSPESFVDAGSSSTPEPSMTTTASTPAPALTSIASSAQAPTIVQMTISNLRYDDVAGDPQLKKSVVSVAQKSIAEVAGVSEESVQVTLSSGSVVVTAVVQPPAGKGQEILKKLETSADTLASTLEDGIEAVPGIDAAKDGDIGVSSVEVKKADSAPDPAAKNIDDNVRSKSTSKDNSFGSGSAAEEDDGLPLIIIVVVIVGVLIVALMAGALWQCQKRKMRERGADDLEVAEESKTKENDLKLSQIESNDLKKLVEPVDEPEDSPPPVERLAEPFQDAQEVMDQESAAAKLSQDMQRAVDQVEPSQDAEQVGSQKMKGQEVQTAPPSNIVEMQLQQLERSKDMSSATTSGAHVHAGSVQQIGEPSGDQSEAAKEPSTIALSIGLCGKACCVVDSKKTAMDIAVPAEGSVAPLRKEM